MSSGAIWAAVCVLAAVAALTVWLAPLSPAWVEREYSSSRYLSWQQLVTPLANALPVALFDVLLIVAIVVLIVVWRRRYRAVRRAAGRWDRAGRWPRQLVLALLDLAGLAALLYLWFALSWGLNYERPPLATRLDFDRARVTRASVLAMAQTTVAALNRLEPLASQRPWPGFESTRFTLSRAFDNVQRQLGQPALATTGRPKSTLLNPYFRWAAIDGMTDPFFLETLVSDDALPIERPFIIAHEWGHLAGYAQESEANFLGWLTCLDAGEQAQYSAWLALYWHLAAALPAAERRTLDAALHEGPTRDLRAIAARYEQSAPRVRVVAWTLYDRFLKANRVAEGIASYDAVVSLVVGTRFVRPWTPALKIETPPTALTPRVSQ
jgi:Protein of unknown function (DUF3810)